MQNYLLLKSDFLYESDNSSFLIPHFSFFFITFAIAIENRHPYGFIISIPF